MKRFLVFLLPLLLGACGVLNEPGRYVGISSDLVPTHRECLEETRTHRYRAGVACQAGVNDKNQRNLEALQARDQQNEEQARANARSAVRYDPVSDAVLVPFDCDALYSRSIPARAGCKWGLQQGKEDAWRKRAEYQELQGRASYQRGRSAVPPILSRY